MEDLQKIAERERLYESIIPIKTENEVGKEEYLRRLTKQERENISKVFDSFDILFHCSMSVMALAVGSTTFSDKYWTGLKEYLLKNDPSKLDYANRKGEDIDILLCTDGPYEASADFFKSWTRYARKDLDQAEITYVLEEDGREDGGSYLTVPTEYKIQEGQGVIRHKRISYGKPSLNISCEGSRDIHLSFDTMLGEMKLKTERVRDYPFSLLFRHNDRSSLMNLIERLNKEINLSFL